MMEESPADNDRNSCDVREAKRARMTQDDGDDDGGVDPPNPTFRELTDRFHTLKQEEGVIQQEIEAKQRELDAKQRQLYAKRSEIEEMSVEIRPFLVASIPDVVWAKIFSFLPFDNVGIKGCTVLNKRFFSLAPLICYPEGFVLQIRMSSDLVRATSVRKSSAWAAFLKKRQLDLLARFRHMKHIRIVEYKQRTVQPAVLRTILSCFPALERLAIYGLDSEEGYLKSNFQLHEYFETCIFERDDEDIIGIIHDVAKKEFGNMFAPVEATLRCISFDKCYVAPPYVMKALSYLHHLEGLTLVMDKDIMSKALHFFMPIPPFFEYLEQYIEDDTEPFVGTHTYKNEVYSLGEATTFCLAQAVPSLKELTVKYDDYYVNNNNFQTGFVTGCAELRNLRVLHNPLPCFKSEAGANETTFQEKFAQMIDNLESLQ